MRAPADWTGFEAPPSPALEGDHGADREALFAFHAAFVSRVEAHRGRRLIDWTRELFLEVKDRFDRTVEGRFPIALPPGESPWVALCARRCHDVLGAERARLAQELDALNRDSVALTVPYCGWTAADVEQARLRCEDARRAAEDFERHQEALRATVERYDSRSAFGKWLFGKPVTYDAAVAEIAKAPGTRVHLERERIMLEARHHEITRQRAVYTEEMAVYGPWRRAFDQALDRVTSAINQVSALAGKLRDKPHSTAMCAVLAGNVNEAARRVTQSDLTAAERRQVIEASLGRKLPAPSPAEASEDDRPPVKAIGARVRR